MDSNRNRKKAGILTCSFLESGKAFYYLLQFFRISTFGTTVSSSDIFDLFNLRSCIDNVNTDWNHLVSTTDRTAFILIWKRINHYLSGRNVYKLIFESRLFFRDFFESSTTSGSISSSVFLPQYQTYSSVQEIHLSCIHLRNRKAFALTMSSRLCNYHSQPTVLQCEFHIFNFYRNQWFISKHFWLSHSYIIIYSSHYIYS